MDDMRTPRNIATIISLILALGLLAASSAHAAGPSVATDRAVALAAWGPAPCGDVAIKFDDWTVGRLAYTQPVYANLAASPCVIHLSPDFEGRLDRDDALLRCHTIAHEWGHLTGHQHTRRGLMARTVKGAYYWRCRAAAKR